MSFWQLVADLLSCRSCIAVAVERDADLLFKNRVVVVRS